MRAPPAGLPMTDAQHPPDDAAPPRRSIRSFVLRTGRMGTGQIRALETLAPKYVLPCAQQVLVPEQVFGRKAPVVLEIGFGMGDATAQIAELLPETDFIGVEVHTPGVGALLQRIEEKHLGNLRIVQHDAVEVLAQMIAPGSLAGVPTIFTGQPARSAPDPTSTAWRYQLGCSTSGPSLTFVVR